MRRKKSKATKRYYDDALSMWIFRVKTEATSQHRALRSHFPTVEQRVSLLREYYERPDVTDQDRVRLLDRIYEIMDDEVKAMTTYLNAEEELARQIGEAMRSPDYTRAKLLVALKGKSLSEQIRLIVEGS